MIRTLFWLTMPIFLLLCSCAPLPWNSASHSPSTAPDQDTIAQLIARASSCPTEETSEPLAKMGFTVQVGAFGQQENAVRFQQTLQGRGVDAYHFLHESGLYKVRFGNYDRYEQARHEAEQLQRQGVIESFFIVFPDDYAVAQISHSGQNGLREELVKTAQRFLGVPYRWGGEDRKNGFDCSGLTMVSYRLNGLNLPRNSRMQYRAGRCVAKRDLQKGDLVFFATKGGKRVTHVGMYVGDNRFIHAPRTGKTIRFSSLSSKFWRQTYVGGRTYL